MPNSLGTILRQEAQRQAPKPNLPQYGDGHSPKREPPPEPPTNNWAKIIIGTCSIAFLAVGGVLAFGFNPTTLLQQIFTALLMGSGIGGVISVLQGGAEYQTKDGIKAWGAAAIFLIILTLVMRVAGIMPTETNTDSAEVAVSHGKMTEARITRSYNPRDRGHSPQSQA